MRKNKLFIISLLALTLCACNSTGGSNSTSTSNNSSIEIIDLIGRKNTINPGSFKQVVCIGAGALRLYSYVGDVSILSGVEDIDNTSLTNRPKMFDGVARPYVIAYGDTFSKLPSCGVGGPMAQLAEAEKILNCNPDIVIAEYEDVDKANALQEQLGVPVITLRYGAKGVFDDNIKNSINLLGKVFNKNEKATALNDYIETQKEEIFNKTKDIKEEDKKSVYIGGLGNWGTTNQYMTAQNYEPFNVAHIKNVVNDLSKDGIQEIEKEKFVDLGKDMDIMILDAAAIKNIKPLYKEDSTIFDECKAWQNGEVYLQMAYNAYYTNVELALANTWCNAKIVYPEVFEYIDIEDKVNEICTQFLGQNLYSKIVSYPNSFGGYQKIDTKTFFA